MPLITRLYNFQNGQRADAVEVNAEFNAILSLLNGNLDSYNLKDAGITSSKLLSVNGDKIEQGTITEDRLAFFISHIDDTNSSPISHFSSEKVMEILSNYREKTDSYTISQIDTKIGAINTELNTKANASNVYSRDTLDGKFLEKADKITTYTKTEVDNALTLKIDLLNAYTKTDIDGFLGGKADKTKTESDISALNTALGTKADKTATENSISSLQTSITAVNTALGGKASVEEVGSLSDQVNSLGGIVGQSQKIIYQSPTPPDMALPDDIWIDTSATPNLLKRYDGALWGLVGGAGGGGSVEIPAEYLTQSEGDSRYAGIEVESQLIPIYSSFDALPTPTDVGQHAIADGILYVSDAPLSGGFEWGTGVYTKQEANSRFATLGSGGGIPVYPTLASFPAATGEGIQGVAQDSGLRYISKSNGLGTTDLIPKMTAQTTAGTTITASSIYTTSYPWMVGNDLAGSDGWMSASGAIPAWLQIDFGVAKTFGGISILTSNSFANRYPKDFTIKTSNDGVTWETALTVSGIASWGMAEKRYFEFPANKTARYLKLDCTAVGGGTFLQIIEMEVLQKSFTYFTGVVPKIESRTRIEYQLASNFLVTSTGRKVLPFATKLFDTNSEFNTTNFTFTAKSSMLIALDVNLWVQSLQPNRYAVAGYTINGVDKRTWQTQGANIVNASSGVTTVNFQEMLVKDHLWLNAGDTLQIWLDFDALPADNTLVSSAVNFTRFTINQLY